MPELEVESAERARACDDARTPCTATSSRSLAETSRLRAGVRNLPTRFAVITIRIYQLTLSPLLGPHCRFAPSCSQYTLEAISRYGLIRGAVLGARRIGRCHPFHEGGFDPVP